MVFQTITGAHRDWVKGLAFMPGGNCLVSGDRTGSVKLWNIDDCSMLGEVQAHRSQINSITTNSNLIFTASEWVTVPCPPSLPPPSPHMHTRTRTLVHKICHYSLWNCAVRITQPFYCAFYNHLTIPFVCILCSNLWKLYTCIQPKYFCLPLKFL